MRKNIILEFLSLTIILGLVACQSDSGTKKGNVENKKGKKSKVSKKGDSKTKVSKHNKNKKNVKKKKKKGKKDKEFKNNKKKVDKKVDKHRKVIAIINGKKIYADELLERLVKSVVSRNILRRMIDEIIWETLIEQAGKKHKIPCTKEEIEDRVVYTIEYGDVETKKKSAGKQTFEDVLKKRGYKSLEEYRQFLKVHIKYWILAEKLYKYFEIRDGYVQVRHILFNTKVEAERALKKLKEGADFAKMAKQLSLDDISKNAGGKLPPFSKEDDLKWGLDFKTTALSMKKGDLSDVIKSKFGYHVIKVIAKKEARDVSFKDVEKKIVDELDRSAKTQRISRLQAFRLYERLKRNAKVEIKLEGLK